MKKNISDVWANTRPFRPVLIIVIVLFVFFSAVVPGFFTPLNIQNILASQSILWIIAIGMTLVIISGGFDLSVGSNAAVCGIFLAKVLEAQLLPEPIALVATIIFGAVIGGVLNGIFIGFFRLNVFVVTLASMIALEGVVYIWTNLQSIYISAPVVDYISIYRLFGVQTPIYTMVLIFVIFLFIQKYTFFGRDVYATGGNYTAARLSGIRTTRTLIIVYSISGACAGLGGAIMIGRIGAAMAAVNGLIALDAVAAVLIGGTALIGGAGSIVGTAFGVLFLGILQNGLDMVGVSSHWQRVVTGIILIISVMGITSGGRRGGILSSLKKALGARTETDPNLGAVEPASKDSSGGNG
jgi:ribose/xylose/arabinose/galactoside ABC-type transport system permease subunit